LIDAPATRWTIGEVGRDVGQFCLRESTERQRMQGFVTRMVLERFKHHETSGFIGRQGDNAAS
jgi:hypothetical protein